MTWCPGVCVCMSSVLLHLADETIVQDLSLGLSYLLALPDVSQCLCAVSVVSQSVCDGFS